VDSELIIDLSQRIKRVVTIEENILSGGFGSSVVRLLQKSVGGDIRVKSIGLPDEFVEQGAQVILRSKYGLDAKGIVQQVLPLFPENEMSSYFAHSKISL